eukprot:SAG31_NODE_4866_length_2899_cov_2.048929_3_plen_315_part_01
MKLFHFNRAYGTLSAPLFDVRNVDEFTFDGGSKQQRYGYMFGGVIGLEVQTRLLNGSITPYHRFRQNPYRLSDLWKFEIIGSTLGSPSLSLHASAKVTWSFIKPQYYNMQLMNQGRLTGKNSKCGYVCLHVENGYPLRATGQSETVSLSQAIQTQSGPGPRYRHAAWATHRRRLYEPVSMIGTTKTMYSPDVKTARCSLFGIASIMPLECGGRSWTEEECNAVPNCVYLIPDSLKPAASAHKYQTQHVLYVFGGLGGSDPLVELSDLWQMTRTRATDNEIRDGLQSDDNFGPPRWTYIAGNLETAPRNGAVVAPL